MATYQRIMDSQASLATSNHPPVHTLAVNLPSNNSHLSIYENPVTEAPLNWSSLPNVNTASAPAPPAPCSSSIPQASATTNSSISNIPARNRASLQDPVTGENLSFTSNDSAINSPLHRLQARIPAPSLPNPLIGETVAFATQDPINNLPLRTTIPARIRASLQNPLTGETIAFASNAPESCRLEAPMSLSAQHVLNSGTVPTNSNSPQVLPFNNTHDIVDLNDNIQSEVVINTSPDGSHSHIHHHVHQHHYHHSHPNRLHYFGVPHQLQITISPQMVI